MVNWFMFGEKSGKTEPTRGRYGPAIVVGREKNNVFMSYRVRVTKVASECLRKASVAEKVSSDITTKEKALFEMTLDKENSRGKI